ncbi:MAG: GtrA family protein [Chitinophagaceae bacterium]
MMRKFILSVIDLFYPLFSKWINLQTFRYLACGGFTTFLDILVFFLSFHFILHEKMVHLGVVTISPYIAAFMMSFCISFPTGFMLSKYIVFQQSNLQSRIQLFRYFVLVGCCILLNYVFLKFFVEQCHFFPTVAKLITTVFVAFFSYLTQKNFTFQVKIKKG